MGRKKKKNIEEKLILSLNKSVYPPRLKIMTEKDVEIMCRKINKNDCLCYVNGTNGLYVKTRVC
jgi:hypothetical protein